MCVVLIFVIYVLKKQCVCESVCVGVFWMSVVRVVCVYYVCVDVCLEAICFFECVCY